MSWGREILSLSLIKKWYFRVFVRERTTNFYLKIVIATSQEQLTRHNSGVKLAPERKFSMKIYTHKTHNTKYIRILKFSLFPPHLFKNRRKLTFRISILVINRPSTYADGGFDDTLLCNDNNNIITTYSCNHMKLRHSTICTLYSSTLQKLC